MAPVWVPSGTWSLVLPAVEGGHLDVAPEGGLGHVDRHLAEEVRALALEEGVLLDPEHDVEVARGAARPCRARPRR